MHFAQASDGCHAELLIYQQPVQANKMMSSAACWELSSLAYAPTIDEVMTLLPE